jgi:hypothetical protein
MMFNKSGRVTFLEIVGGPPSVLTTNTSIKTRCLKCNKELEVEKSGKLVYYKQCGRYSLKQKKTATLLPNLRAAVCNSDCFDTLVLEGSFNFGENPSLLRFRLEKGSSRPPLDLFAVWSEHTDPALTRDGFTTWVEHQIAAHLSDQSQPLTDLLKAIGAEMEHYLRMYSSSPLILKSHYSKMMPEANWFKWLIYVRPFWEERKRIQGIRDKLVRQIILRAS